MSLPLHPLDDRIELRARTGSGAMGEVHRAWDDQLERAVAVKFQLAVDEREAERLLLEARLQARVEHPNVIKVHEVGTLGGRVCIVFQLVDGPTLGELAPRLTPSERVELLRQAALGLHAAHLQGLVHRDVKPGNVLVEEGPEGARRALLGDFGLARAEEGGLSRTGVPAGTLEYMSPEQLLGSGPVDFRSDVYALGASLYALLAGRPPFRSGGAAPGGEDSSGLFRRVLEEEPEPLHRVAPGTPRELGLVAARAMEKSPADRYPTAEAFAEELGRFLRGEPVLARPPSLTDRGVKWARRNRVAARALAAAAAAVLTAGGLAAWSSRQASLEALESARLGADAASLESRLRMEYLSEPHDLRPTQAAIKAEVERLRPLAARGSGPASYALGKGLDLLDDLDGARAAYERARALGFRTPSASEALGSALARIYEREWRRAQGLGPADRTARLAALASELVEPARGLFAEGAATGWRGAWLRSTLAIMDGDYLSARKLVAETVAADPARYEARVVEGRSWLAEGRLRYLANQLDDAIAALDQAIASLVAASRGGRSDPEVLRLLSEAHLRRGQYTQAKGLDPSPEVELALAALDAAARLDPEAPRLPALRGLALQLRGLRAMQEGRSEGASTLDLSEAQFERAIRLRPEEPGPYLELAYGLYAHAVYSSQGQQHSPHALLQRALEVTEAGQARAPRSPQLLRMRANILSEEGRALQTDGKDASGPFSEAIRLCDEALALDPTLRGSVMEVQLHALIGLAKAQWQSGLDPRQAFSRAVEAGEEIQRTTPGWETANSYLAEALGEFGNVLLDMGEDPRPEMERAVALIAPLVAPARRPTSYWLMRAAYYVAMDAIRRSVVHEDPASVVTQARDLIARASHDTGEAGFSAELLGILALCNARGLAASGRSPLAELDVADRTDQALAAQAPAYSAVRRVLAQVALERALWLRRSGASPVAAARAGLVHAEKGAELDPLEAHLAILEARLLALAGDPAAARRRLDRAYTIQPLVKGSREAKAAEAELAP